MNPKPRKHSRAAGQTSISVSVPVSVKEKLSAMAKADNRTLSNFLCLHFNRLLEIAERNDTDAGRAAR